MMSLFYNRERHQRANSFGLLLLAQLFLILAPAIFTYLHWPWIASLGTALVILTSLYIATTTKRDLYIGLAIVAIPIALLFLDAPHPTEAPGAEQAERVLALITMLLVVVFFVYIMFKLAQQVLAKHKVDANVLMAAIAGYIMIGMVGGYLVRIVQILSPGAFNMEPSVDGYTYLYFSFVTITTLGYGDISPQLPIGQALVVILAILGQMYITIVIAMIIGRMLSSSGDSSSS